MATEECPICGEHVPFSNTVHVMLNPRDEGGVVDFYVCRACYEADIEPLFADAIAAAANADAEGDAGEPADSGDGDAASADSANGDADGADPDEEDATSDPTDGDTASVDPNAEAAPDEASPDDAVEEATPDASGPLE